MSAILLANAPVTENFHAEELSRHVLQEIVGDHPLSQLNVRFWSGDYWPDAGPRRATLVLNHPGALRHMLQEGTETGLARSFLYGDCDVEGDMEAAFELIDLLLERTGSWGSKLRLSHLLHQLPERCGPVAKAGTHHAFLHGRPHSPGRDREAIQFHYDLSNEFYSLWLDAERVYSCAYFKNQSDGLDTAQRQKLDYICRKLALKPGQRLLDIGCGWGGLILHAARQYGVNAVGITLSPKQAEYVRSRIESLHLEKRVEVRIADYRELNEWESFDAMASVGMVEHVGLKKLPGYFAQAYRLLKPRGLFLNHGIGLGAIPRLHGGSAFIDEYVFPDAELVSIAKMLAPAEEAGFEIRDVENLREHYAMTLRRWVQRLEKSHVQALRFVTEPVYRIWRLYMAGSAHGFHIGQLAIYQTLLTKLSSLGQSPMSLTRQAWCE